MPLTVSNIERGMKNLKKELEEENFRVEFHTFRSGNIRDSKSSYVDVTVIWKEGLRHSAFTQRLLANGYSGLLNDEIGSYSMTWTEMKAEFMDKFDRWYRAALDRYNRTNQNERINEK